MAPAFRKYFLCILPWCAWVLLYRFIPESVQMPFLVGLWIELSLGGFLVFGLGGILFSTEDKLLKLSVGFPLIVYILNFILSAFLLFGRTPFHFFFLFNFLIASLYLHLGVCCILMAAKIFRKGKIGRHIILSALILLSLLVIIALSGSIFAETFFAFLLAAALGQHYVLIVPVTLLGLYLHYFTVSED